MRQKWTGVSIITSIQENSKVKKIYIVVDKYVLAAFSENTLILKKKQKKHE
jgi:hypothetical protein